MRRRDAHGSSTRRFARAAAIGGGFVADQRRADATNVGVRQREFLHALHDKAEEAIAENQNGRRSPN